MGQTINHSRDDFNEMDFLHEQIRKHSLTLRQLTFLTNDDFHCKIKDLNELSSKYIDCNSKQLLFEIKPGTDGTVLWKGTVRIKCIKLDSKTGNIDKCREFNLKQFLQVYNTLQQHLTSASEEGQGGDGQPNDAVCCTADDASRSVGPKKIDMNSSIILENLGKIVELDPPAGHSESTSNTQGQRQAITDDDYCCICMESRIQVSLPCAHSYCLACIEQWNVNHKTCPICRETLETTDDTWVLEDRPNSDDVSQEIQKSLFALTK